MQSYKTITQIISILQAKGEFMRIYVSRVSEIYLMISST